MVAQPVKPSTSISTHAPAGGATIVAQGGKFSKGLFLLTPLREGRRKQDLHRVVRVRISTHAPAGGATRSRRRCRTPLAHFYSRPCGRGDMVDAVNQLQNDLFLLTPLREGRLSVSRQAIRVKENFYSRPCGRGDDFVVTTKQKGAISTHAPAGGATDSYAVSLNFVYPFLLTPLREGRPGFTAIFRAEAVFLLTPLREGRHVLGLFLAGQVDDFYSRPCGRGDRTDPQSGH